ncbi:putative disease resistance protein RGA3 [Miscanthus floridulus]|uniref:putative disease resistance protein RGA3 n=1 Tax=Miscanthus floridulus TaxID=154761 RepID=UPI003458E609
MACSAAAAAAGWLVSPFLDNLSSRLRSYADDLLRYLPLSESASADLQRLKDYLLRLHAYASTVERAQRRPPHPTLLAWFNRLQDAAHDADDILDEISYRRLADALIGPRPDLCSILDTPGQLCSRLVSVCSDHPFKRLPSVLDKLANACADYAGIASLVGIDAPKSPQRGNRLSRNSSSIIPADDAFFGRQRELHVLVEMLVGGNGSAQLQSQSVPVVAIVGDGGIGKTKLAQTAFNHANIQEHFDPLMWVCVSSHLDDMRITREILQAATDWKVDYDGIVNFDRLQKLLVSAVAGRRFLLVLDDVWDDNEMSMWDNGERWRKLLAPLQNGNQESRIIVTTRMKMVADMLGVRMPVMLGGLETKENWLLLKKCALGSENSREHPRLQDIGRKIASNLNGSPLAARVIGGRLSNTRIAREWNNISETDIHGDIVSTLLSSYYHLPQHLQHCFAYCSIFPKNWKFERKKLIRMWIAQGFVHMENGSMEDAGIEYFKQLLARSFFHTLRQGNRTHYVMHDLIHDLAQIVSRCDCARMEGNKSKTIPSTVRHVSVSSSSLPWLKEQFDLRRLRTLVVFKDSSMTSSTIPHDFLAEVKNVRTLDLTGCLISEVPEAIGYLIHLRYIALPGTIKMLPESVSMLLHLQTLDIPKKCQLDGFPKGMHLLVNLRHLGVDLTYMSMIRGIGTLVNLQGSIEFHVKKEQGQSLVELKDMNNLHGLLHIKYLENVQCKEEACNAELSNKRYLKILKLEWNSASSAFGPTRDAEVLEGLEPNPNLEELHIKRYKGESSPSWWEVKILSQLKSLYLTNCRRWKLLPSLGQLPLLKVLHLKEMCSVTEISPKFYGGGPESFPSLKYLEFDDMPNLVSWVGENGASFFPCLQKLKILNCPKLIEVPLLPPTTKSVTVERTQKIYDLKLTPYCSSKSRKFILEISSGHILNEGFLHQKHLEATEVLNIRGCWGLEHAGGFRLLSSLRKLRLSQCNMDGEQLSLCLQHLTCLASLDIVYCQNITSFLLPAGSRHFETLQHLCFQDCQMLSSLANLDSFVFLKSLIIERCIRVKTESLPAKLEGMRSLNKLSILHCPGFQTLPSNIPLSLEFLHLTGCHPVLIQGLLEKQGPEWEKIAPFSQIKVILK